MKKLLFPFVSAFLAYQFYELLRIVELNNADELHWISNFAFAFFIALCGTGIFAFVGFAYPTSKLLSNSYYRIKNPKKLQKVYAILGVKYFKYILLLFFWESKKNREKYFNGTRTGINNFVYQTHQSEFGHLGALLLVAITNLYALYLCHYGIAIFLFAINIVGNLYPIILQRHHRIRLETFIR